ncbi:hypothetical protein [Caudoviricetes sp.]|nr:hypothetical protein [Caudoviricetes sp.]UOF81867.1 hypothetical protein [Caudoviricetes sp.]
MVQHRGRLQPTAGHRGLEAATRWASQSDDRSGGHRRRPTTREVRGHA